LLIESEEAERGRERQREAERGRERQRERQRERERETPASYLASPKTIDRTVLKSLDSSYTSELLIYKIVSSI